MQVIIEVRDDHARMVANLMPSVDIYTDECYYIKNNPRLWELLEAGLVERATDESEFYLTRIGHAVKKQYSEPNPIL